MVVLNKRLSEVLSETSLCLRTRDFGLEDWTITWQLAKSLMGEKYTPKDMSNNTERTVY